MCTEHHVTVAVRRIAGDTDLDVEIAPSRAVDYACQCGVHGSVIEANGQVSMINCDEHHHMLFLNVADADAAEILRRAPVPAYEP